MHAGFSTSWQSGLKQAVCKVLQQVVNQPASKPGNMQLLITGKQPLGGEGAGGGGVCRHEYDPSWYTCRRNLQLLITGWQPPGGKRGRGGVCRHAHDPNCYTYRRNMQLLLTGRQPPGGGRGGGWLIYVQEGVAT